MTELQVLLSCVAASESEWLQNMVAPWEQATFPELLLADLKDSDRTALIFEGEQWTYNRLARTVNQTARALIGQYGIQPGDRVILKSENSDLFVVCYLAIHKAGGVAVPVNTKLTQSELDYQIKDSNPSLIVSSDRLIADTPVISLKQLVDTDTAPVDLPRIAADSPATIFYTSGTTGAPKGVIHTHRTLISGAFQNRRGWGYEDPNSITLAMTPLFHIAAHSWFYPVLIGRGTLVIDSYRTERALELIERYKVDGFGAVPAMLLMMLDHPKLADYDLSSIKNIRFGASSIPPERIKELRAAFPNAKLFHGMGQTESGGTISVLPDEYAISKQGSSGPPIPGVSVKIVDELGRTVPRGVSGEILARGPHLMSGYLNQPKATAETLPQDGWLRTGDVGIMDDEGMVRLVDRKKDMIIRAGENIYSSEVENVYLLHEAVQECAVIGLPDPLFQEIVAAVIVTTEAPTAQLREALDRFGRQHLASFKIPTRWFVTDSLPKTATGKVQKQHIRRSLSERLFTEF